MLVFMNKLHMYQEYVLCS